MFDIYSTYCHTATSILIKDFISYFFCYRCLGVEGLSKEEIYTALAIGENSEDGLDLDDSIKDPNYFPK